MQGPKPKTNDQRPTKPEYRIPFVIWLSSFLILLARSVSASDYSPPAILQWFETSWNTMQNRSPDVFMAGYGAVQVPPPYRADSGNQSVGYDIYNRFDLGSPGNSTLYGTQAGLQAAIGDLHQTGVNVYADMVWNQDGFSQWSTVDSSGHSFINAGGYPGFVLSSSSNPANTPNSEWGDFHNPSDTGDQNMQLAGLIDIAQDSNNMYIRSPVPGYPNLIPAGTTAAFGRLANVPTNANLALYPDTSLQPIIVYNPGTGQQNIKIYPFNLANPMNGTPVQENALGYLMRNSQWLVQVIGFDGFRIDAAKNFPSWVLNYYDQAVYRSSFRTLLNGSQEQIFAYSEVYDSNWSTVQPYINYSINPANPGTIGGNRDALDFSLFFALQNNLTGNGYQNNWNNVKGASEDLADDGLMNGSQGVKFVSSADNGAPYLSNVAYAYTLLTPGNAIVYTNGHEFGSEQQRPFPQDGRGDALGGVYGNAVTTLLNIRNTHGSGNFIERYVDQNSYAFERDNSMVVLLSNRTDAGYDSRTITTDFAPGTPLIELTGNAANPAIDPRGDIPPLVVVNSDHTINVRFLRNSSFDASLNSFFTGDGYLAYGLSGPQGTLSLSNTVSVLPGAPPSASDNGTEVLTPTYIVRSNTFNVTLNTNAVNLLGFYRDKPADGDNALIKMDGGIPLNGDGNVDYTTPNTSSYGFDNFVTVHSPGYFSANGNGQYVQSIDATQLSDGYHYITVRAFRHRDDGGPAVFTDFKEVIYVDRNRPNSAVQSFNPIVAGVNQNRNLIVDSVDGTANSVHVFLNLPASMTDAQILAMIGGANQSGSYDTNLFQYGFYGVNSGNNVATIVTYRPTGTFNIQRVPGLSVSGAVGAGLGDLNFDGQINTSDITLFHNILVSNDQLFNPAADVAGSGHVDTVDAILLQGVLTAANVDAATMSAYNSMMATTPMNGIIFRAGEPSYNLLGDAILLAGPVQNQSGLNQAIGLNMTLQSGSGVFDTGGNSLTISGVLSGSGGLWKSGAGTLNLTAANTYSGATTVGGGLLALSGSGAISSTSSIMLVGGTLLLDNSSVNNTSRVPNGVPVTLCGGEMSLTGNTLGTTQTIGSLSLLQGYSTITVNPVGAPAEWSTGTFTRGAGATALVRGPALGTGGTSSVAQIMFSNSPALSNTGTGTSVGILPYLFGDNSPTGNGTDLVTYNVTYGVCLLSGSQYSPSVTANTNVKLTSSAAAVSADTSILALVLANAGTSTQLAINSGATLTLANGAVLSTGSTANSITGGTLTFGANSATSYEGIVYTASDLTIGSAVTDNGANAVSLTKSGPGTLNFTGANTYSGGSYIVGGTLQVSLGASLISGGAITVSGGGSGAALNVSGGVVSTSNSGNAFYLGNIAGQTGTVNVSSGSVAATNASGSIVLGDSGTGIWNQTGGTTTAANQILGANGTGSAGQLNVSGGYVSAANSILVAQGGTGTLNLSGNGVVETPYLAMVGWTNSAATATVNLNGGTLAVGSVNKNFGGQIASGQATFNFNGGLLQATTSSTAFMQGVDYAFVQTGGAFIDTQGYNDTISVALQFSGSNVTDGGLTKYGSGTLVLTGNNTFTGPTAISSGTLQIGAGGATGRLGTGTVTNNGALVFNLSLTGDYTPPAISGSGTVTVNDMLNNSGLVLSTSSSYTGKTYLNGGRVSAAADTSFGAAPGSYVPDQLTMNGGVLMNYQSSTVITANRGITLGPGGGALRAGWNGTLTVASVITGPSSLLIADDNGTVVLANTANSFAGALVIGDTASGLGSGTPNTAVSLARLTGGGSLSSMSTSSNSAANLVFNPGLGGTATLIYAGSGDTTDRLFTLNGNAAIYASGAAPLSFSNTGAIAFGKAGAITFSLGGSGPGVNSFSPLIGNNGGSATTLASTGSTYWLVSGSNSFTGSVSVRGGTLGLGNSIAFGPATNVLTVAAGGVDLCGNNLTVNGLSDGLPAGSISTGLVTTSTGSATLTLTDNNQQFGGSITGAIAVVIQPGNGYQMLSGSNGYTGPTTLNSGSTLVLGSSGNLPGNVQIGAGTGGQATLVLGGPNQLAPNGTITFDGAASGVAVLKLLGNSQTVGGISGNGGNNVIQNSGGESNIAPATLTINNAGNSTYSGYLQNTFQGTNVGALSVVKSGGGVQTLAGSLIMYSGSTAVIGGTLVLQDATGSRFSGGITDSANLIVSSSSGETIQFNGGTLQGSGTLAKTGPGNLLWGANSSPWNVSMGAGGLIDVEGGLLRNEFGVGNWTSNFASLKVAAGATVDLWNSPGGITVDALSGAGTVTHTNFAATSGVAEPLTVGVANGSGTFSGTITDQGGNYLLALVKNGTGTQILTGSNTYTGGTSVNSGVLSFVNGALSLGTIAMAGTSTLQWYGNNTQDISAKLQAIPANATAQFDTNGNNVTFATALHGSGNVTKTGSGTLTLTAANSYSGTTMINAGTLALSGSASIGTSSAITVTPGAVLDASRLTTPLSISAAQTLSAGRTGTPAPDLLGNVTLNGGIINIGSGAGTIATLTTDNTSTLALGSGTVNFDLTSTPTSSGGTNDTINAANVSLSGPITLNVNPVNGFLGSGVYNLINFSGALSGGTSNLLLAGVSSIGIRESINLLTSGNLNGSVELNVAISPANLIWSGTAGSAWNVASTQNWINTTGGTLDYFYNNDGVTFSDSGANGSVTLAANVSPASVAFTNNSLAYTISGTGSIVGTTGLSKSGTGTVILANSNGNDFTGATSITGGALVLASSSAVHNSAVAVNVNNGLKFSPGVATFVLGNLSGSGGLSLSDTAGGAVAVSIGGNGQNSTFSGAMSGSGSLTKAGGGLLSLAGTAVAYTGNTTVSSGTLQFYNARNFSNGNKPGDSFSIASGAVLEFYTDNASSTTDGANQLLGTIQGGGSVFSGNGTFRKTGNGILASGQGTTGTYMTFALSNSGLIDIEGGTLRNGGWQDTTWTNNQSSMYIAAGATLDLWDGKPIFIDALKGAGTITKGQGNGGTVTLNVGVAGGSGTFSGVIQNPQTYISLVKAGTGLQVLSGNNSYSGPTTISAGTLQVGNGAASGSINATSSITDNATLVFNRSDVSSVSVSISGSGNVAKAGTGTISFSTSNTYTGSTAITGGVLRLQTPTLAAAGAGTPLIWFDPSNPVGGILSGGTITQLTNLGSSGTAGNATAQGGFAPPTLTLSNSAFNALPTVHFSSSQALGGFNLSALNGSSYTVVAVEGKAAAAHSYFLGTNVSATNQSLHMGYRSDTDFALGQYSNDLDYTSAPSYSGAEVARAWAGELNTSTGHTLYLNGSLVASNTNTTPLNSLGGTHYGILGAGPSYGSPFVGDLGEVMIFNSALSPTQVAAVQQYLMAKWTQPDILPTSTPVTISGGGTLDLNGATQTIGSLTSNDSTSAVRLGGGQLNVGADGTSTLFAGAINGAGNLVKIGSGTLTLTGSNSFTGATGVMGGTLQIGNGGSGASIGGTTAIVDNAALAFDIADTSTVSSPISGAGALAMIGGGTLVLSGTNSYAGGTTVANGTVIATNNEAIADGTDLTVGNASLFSAPVVASAAVPVPEPGTIALVAMAVGVASLYRKSRRGGRYQM
jgi:autotransporter-associated beta strand protein